MTSHYLAHADRGLSRLPQKFKDKPTVLALLQIYLEEVQELEDAIWDSGQQRLIVNAIGEYLDVWGKVLNVPRGGLDDEMYRIRLQVELLLLRSSGTVPELVTIYKLLVPTSVPTFMPWYPGSFELLLAGAVVPNGDDYVDVLERAKAGGVRAILRWNAVDPDDTFSFATDSGGLGFGISTDDSVGGNFARASE